LPALLLVHGTAPAIESGSNQSQNRAIPRRGESTVRRRDGFTLVEALIVVVLLGLMVLIGFPKMSAAMSRSDLRSARTTMVNLVAAARAASMQTNRVTWVKIEGTSAYVGASNGATVDTVGTVHDVGDAYGVTVTGVDSIQFDPRGFGAGFGDDASIVLTRAGHSSTITIDGLGRVRK
jgi:prepilin-type N-terminal cleavage/methylation domain-containing protein